MAQTKGTTSNKAKNMSTAKGRSYQANKARKTRTDNMNREENSGFYSGKTYDNEQQKNDDKYLRSVGVKKTATPKANKSSSKK